MLSLKEVKTDLKRFHIIQCVFLPYIVHACIYIFTTTTLSFLRFTYVHQAMIFHVKGTYTCMWFSYYSHSCIKDNTEEWGSNVAKLIKFKICLYMKFEVTLCCVFNSNVSEFRQIWMTKVSVYSKAVGKNRVYVVCILPWSVSLTAETRTSNDVLHL